MKSIVHIVSKPRNLWPLYWLEIHKLESKLAWTLLVSLFIEYKLKFKYAKM